MKARRTWSRARKPLPEWMYQLREGSVIKRKQKSSWVYRVVRNVHWKDGRPWCVMLVKKSAGYSTFGRTSDPCTIYWCSVLMANGWEDAGFRVKLNSEIDERIRQEIERMGREPSGHARDRIITDVEAMGLP